MRFLLPMLLPLALATCAANDTPQANDTGADSAEPIEEAWWILDYEFQLEELRADDEEENAHYYFDLELTGEYAYDRTQSDSCHLGYLGNIPISSGETRIEFSEAERVFPVTKEMLADCVTEMADSLEVPPRHLNLTIEVVLYEDDNLGDDYVGRDWVWPHNLGPDVNKSLDFGRKENPGAWAALRFVATQPDIGP